MKNLFILIVFVSASFCFAYANDTIPADDPLIEYTGRIDFSDPKGPAFSYSGVSIRAAFKGTSIGVIMNDDQGQNFYTVILDGRLLDTIGVTKSKNTILIAEGLENTIHEIELFKRTELSFGKTRFYGFVVDEGESLATITNKRDILIEYIGNSITCGYGNEGSLGESFGPTTENHYMTYAAITSRNFNARHLAVCKSGIGIYRNYNGPKLSVNDNNMTDNYTRIFLFDENPKYEFKEQPDLICINLGTNDFSTSGGDSALYVSNYFRFIDTIQSKYDKPDILCLLGPMMTGTTLSNVRNYLEFIVDSANKKGNGNVYFFEMSTQSGDYGIDYHPTVAQHEINAAELTEYIKTLKGWKINPLVEKVNLRGSNCLDIEFNTSVADNLNNYAGFSVFTDNQQLIIDKVYRDETSLNIIHICLEETFKTGQEVILKYAPGTVQSEGSVALGTINIEVPNNQAKTMTAEEENRIFNIYPNPNRSGILNYGIENAGRKIDGATCEFINTNGVIVFKTYLTEANGKINFRGKVSKGNYLVSFKWDNMYVAKSIVIE